MSRPSASRSDSDLPMKHLDATMIEKLRELIDQWRLEQRGRHERIDQFARIALGEAPTGAPPLQDPELYFWPGLESHPFHDRTVSWMAELEAAYPVISVELTALLDARDRLYSIRPGHRCALSTEKVRPRGRFRSLVDLRLAWASGGIELPEDSRTPATLVPR